MNKLLSICIPTFNRGDLLAIQLENLITQIEKSEIDEKCIEILISDNNSTDNTKDKIQRFTMKPYIKYFCNEENIGPDANFLNLFQISKGDYVWLLGDDDLFTEDMMHYLITKLGSRKIDYLYLKVGKNVFNSKNNTFYSGEDFLQKVTIFSTFMSSQVIKRSLLVDRMSEARAYLGGFMAYYFLFIDAIQKSKNIVISSEPKIFPGSTNNTGGYGFFNVWAKSVFDVLKQAEFQNPKLFDRMRADMLWKLLLPIYIKSKLRDFSRFDLEDIERPLMFYFQDRVKLFNLLSSINNKFMLKLLLFLINIVNLRYALTRSF